MLKRKRPGKKSGKSGWWNGSAWAHRKLGVWTPTKNSMKFFLMS